MSRLPPNRRDAKARATRLAVGFALLLMLAIGIAAAIIRPGSRGGNHAAGTGGADGLNPAPGGAEAVASADPRPKAAGHSGVAVGQDDGDGDGDSDSDPVDGTADEWDDSDGRGRDGQADGPGAGAEELLAAWDHLERQIALAIERARESVVELEYTPADSPSGDRRVASGVVISPRGEILSVRIDPPRAGGGGDGRAGKDNDRGGAAPIVARDHLGRAHAVQWLAADPYTGLTLLRISPRAVRPIHTAGDRPKLGSQIFIVGSPFGMGHSASRGHIAGLERALKLRERRLGGLIQIQAPLYPGDSGAAVVDLRGDWLGLIRGGLANRVSAGEDGHLVAAAPLDAGVEESSAAGMGRRGAAAAQTDRDPDDDELTRPADHDSHFGFAIPSRDALWIADQLRVHGRVDRSYLGVHFVRERPVAAAAAEPSADPGAAASTGTGTGAGDGAGDGAGATGSSATLAVRGWRGAGGTAQAVPSVPSASTKRASGSADDAPSPHDGARLLDVLPGSPAERAGLQPGDCIVGVNGQAIRSRNDLIDRLDRIPARTTIIVRVVREDDLDRPRFEVRVRTASRPSSRRQSAAHTASAGSRPGRASVDVTPTASRIAPPVSEPELPAKGSDPLTPASTSPSSRPSSPPAPDDSTDPARHADGASSTRPNSDHGNAAPTRSGLNELKLNLPRAFVERLEHIERRLDQMEHFRKQTDAGNHGTSSSPTRPNGSRAPADRPGRSSP